MNAVNVLLTILEVYFIPFVAAALMDTFGIVIYIYVNLATLNVLLVREKQIIVLSVWMGLILSLIVTNVVL